MWNKLHSSVVTIYHVFMYIGKHMHRVLPTLMLPLSLKNRMKVGLLHKIHLALHIKEIIILFAMMSTEKERVLLHLLWCLQKKSTATHKNCKEKMVANVNINGFHKHKFSFSLSTQFWYWPGIYHKNHITVWLSQSRMLLEYDQSLYSTPTVANI